MIIRQIFPPEVGHTAANGVSFLHVFDMHLFLLLKNHRPTLTKKLSGVVFLLFFFASAGSRLYVIVVPVTMRVYGICTLRAVICIPEGAARGNTYNCTKSTNPYTLETHGTADLYHNTITNAVSYDKR